MILSLDEAASRLGKTARQVRYLIQKGELTASKSGGRWQIDSTDLQLTGGQKTAKDRKAGALRRRVDEALDVPQKLPRRYSVTDLKAFQLALPLYQESSDELGDDHSATVELRRVLHLLTQGCHRYEHSQKADAYRAARDAASAAVCELVLAGEDAAQEIRQHIEQDLMAALAGLLRRLERRGRGK